ncbi:acyl carrier protein [Kitasatospora sp. SUK 42]|uniref:acyl carrier protein n=1 Tax=Kitasatospora sp. SUK 42 TaxID=1588882 RepID=UPI0018CB69EC|nr:acyl carrier protein [Kitasatospora sp. SUK 42]MBV2155124.1 acyl carrier protein [Kitasatospora sp. SUK 42]
MTALAESTIADHIATIMAEKFEIPAGDIDITASFETMELDSLDLVELAVILTRQYGIALEDHEIVEAGSIEKTVALLRDKGVPIA